MKTERRKRNPAARQAQAIGMLWVERLQRRKAQQEERENQAAAGAEEAVPNDSNQRKEHQPKSVLPAPVREEKLEEEHPKVYFHDQCLNFKIL
jgi:hypothetical protein